MKGFNSKKSKNHKLQHWRSFLSYNNYSRNLLYVHLYLWPYKNGLANLKAQKFVWVSFEVKNQNFCLCYAVCCFVSKSDMMFSFDEKKIINYYLFLAIFFLPSFFRAGTLKFFFEKLSLTSVWKSLLVSNLTQKCQWYWKLVTSHEESKNDDQTVRPTHESLLWARY